MNICCVFSGKGGTDHQVYEITLEFHKEVNPQVSIHLCFCIMTEPLHDKTNNFGFVPFLPTAG